MRLAGFRPPANIGSFFLSLILNEDSKCGPGSTVLYTCCYDSFRLTDVEMAGSKEFLYFEGHSIRKMRLLSRDAIRFDESVDMVIFYTFFSCSLCPSEPYLGIELRARWRLALRTR